MAYRILYSPDAEGHLRSLPRHAQVKVLDSALQQLAHEPLSETRNRRPMRPDPVAPWELRIGRLRVYYDVLEDSAEVRILAVGVKDRNQVRIGGEVIDL